MLFDLFKWASRRRPSVSHFNTIDAKCYFVFKLHTLIHSPIEKLKERIIFTSHVPYVFKADLQVCSKQITYINFSNRIFFFRFNIELIAFAFFPCYLSSVNWFVKRKRKKNEREMFNFSTFNII